MRIKPPSPLLNLMYSNSLTYISVPQVMSYSNTSSKRHLALVLWLTGLALLVSATSAIQSERSPSEPRNIPMPSRGILLERTGTLLAHSGYLTTRFVMTLNHNFAPFYESNEYGVDCNTTVATIHESYQRRLHTLRDIVEDVLSVDNRLIDDDLCQAFNLTADPRCHNPPRRTKRFILGAAALATAGVSMDLGIKNEEQIKIINEMLRDQQRDIMQFKESVKAAFRDQFEQYRLVQNETRNWMATVTNIVTHHDEILQLLNCGQRRGVLQTYVNEALRQLRDILGMALKGFLTRNVTPFMIRKQFIIEMTSKAKGERTRTFFSEHPQMMYKVGRATLIDADFENLQFDFVLLYPDLDSATVASYFAVRQVGMIASHNFNNQTTCVAFDVPENAVFYRNRWQVLQTPDRCQTHGRMVVCNTLHFRLRDIHHCLTQGNIGGPYCPLIPCDAKRDEYISTSSGLLLRTKEPTITITRKKKFTQPEMSPHLQATSIVSTLPVPSSGSMFVEWGINVTSVTFGAIAVHAPPEIKTDSILNDLLPESMPFITLKDIFSIPQVGAENLARALERFDNALATSNEKRESIIEQLHQKPTSSELRETWDTITNIPRYFEVAFIVVACILCFMILKSIKDCIAPNVSLCPPKCCSSDSIPIERFNTDEPPTRRNSQISLVVNNEGRPNSYDSPLNPFRAALRQAPPAPRHSLTSVPPLGNPTYRPVYPAEDEYVSIANNA